MRGARVTKETSLPDGSYEVTVEMKMSGPFQKAVLPPREQEPEPLTFAENSEPKDHFGFFRCRGIYGAGCRCSGFEGPANNVT